jgi:hypothetical protein
MVYLLLSILVSLGIFLVFRLAGKFGLPALPIVGINYLIAVMVGIINQGKEKIISTVYSPWFFVTAFIVGILFMLFFLLVHATTNKAGIAITSAAAKLSVVFPVATSLLIDRYDIIYNQKIIGITVLLLSFSFIMYKKHLLTEIKKSALIFPLILFVGMGFVDSIIKIAQQNYIPENEISLFTLLVFFVAFIASVVVLIIKKKVHLVKRKFVFILGVILGLCNYASLYFFLKALHLNLFQQTFLDSSRIFIINNFGIIALSVIAGVLVFKEKLSWLNYAGILLSIIGFYFIM